MGITLESKNFSIDMGYGGFMRLRNKVAELAGKEIGQHYADLDKAPYFGEERNKFFEQYDRETAELAETSKIPHGILNFLYASDCEGKISASKCKQIYKVIKDYDDNLAYGYCGRSDCATFKDFKKIVNDCIENKCSMKWW